MFKHLVDKPSAQTVSDIIRNAVEIEQVMHTCTDWPPLAATRAIQWGLYLRNLFVMEVVS